MRIIVALFAVFFFSFSFAEASKYDAYLEAQESELLSETPTAVQYADFAGKAYTLGRPDLAEKYATLAIRARRRDCTMMPADEFSNLVLAFVASDKGDDDVALQYAENSASAEDAGWLGQYALARVSEASYKRSGDGTDLELALWSYEKAGELARSKSAEVFGKHFVPLTDGRNLLSVLGDDDAKGIMELAKKMKDKRLGDYMETKTQKDVEEAERWAKKKRKES